MVTVIVLKCGEPVFVGGGGASGVGWGFGHALNNAFVQAGGSQYETTGTTTVLLSGGQLEGKPLIGWGAAAAASSSSVNRFIAVHTAVVDGVMAAASAAAASTNLGSAKLHRACARANQGRSRNGTALSSTHPDKAIKVGAAAGAGSKRSKRSILTHALDPLLDPLDLDPRA
jgi:hypothetical protein